MKSGGVFLSYKYLRCGRLGRDFLAMKLKNHIVLLPRNAFASDSSQPYILDFLFSFNRSKSLSLYLRANPMMVHAKKIRPHSVPPQTFPSLSFKEAISQSWLGPPISSLLFWPFRSLPPLPQSLWWRRAFAKYLGKTGNQGNSYLWGKGNGCVGSKKRRITLFQGPLTLWSMRNITRFESGKL